MNVPEHPRQTEIRPGEIKPDAESAAIDLLSISAESRRPQVVDVNAGNRLASSEKRDASTDNQRDASTDKVLDTSTDNLIPPLQIGDGQSAQPVDISAEKLKREIERAKLPQGWLKGYDENPREWAEKALPAVTLAFMFRGTVVEYAEISKHLWGGELKYELPKGASVLKDAKGDVKRTHLDLPATLDLTSSDDFEKIARIGRWLEKHRGILDRTRLEMGEGARNLSAAFFWGDLELGRQSGRFDSDGKFLGIAQQVAGKGSESKEFNLLEKRLEVERVDGKIVAKMTVQPQMVPLWGYQNLIFTNIGKPMTVEKQFEPDDLVPVSDGQKVRFVKADELQNYVNWQKGMHYGTKALMTALDTSFVVTGTAGVAAATRGMRLLHQGTNTGLQLSQNHLRWQLAHKGANAMVGTLGLVDNAGGHEYSAVNWALKAREYYIVGEAARGLYGFGLRQLKPNGEAARRFGRGDANIDSLIRGVSPEGTRFAPQLVPGYRAAQKVGTVTQIGATALIAREISETVKEKF